MKRRDLLKLASGLLVPYIPERVYSFLPADPATVVTIEGRSFSYFKYIVTFVGDKITGYRIDDTVVEFENGPPLSIAWDEGAHKVFML